LETSEIFSCGFINSNNTNIHPLLSSFKDLWSENGDSISFQYAGTASCITSVTKNGKHGFLGFFQHGLVSIKRFYQGNFDDGFKQKCIDSLLQKNRKSIFYPLIKIKLYEINKFLYSINLFNKISYRKRRRKTL
jgi:hypothetical protein